MIRNTAIGRKDRFASAGPCRRARRSRGSCRAARRRAPPIVVAEARGDAVDQPLELGIGERVALAAALADRVVVVLAARVGGLEAGGAVDVEPVDEAQRGQHLERAVDAGEPRRAAVARAQPVVDLLRAQAAALALEQREHLLARAAGAMAGAGQLAARVRAPAAGCSCVSVATRWILARHTANENGLQ